MKRAIEEQLQNLQEELMETVSNMVKIPSITPEFGESCIDRQGETKVNEILREIMEKMGLEIDIFSKCEERCNLVGVCAGTGEGKSLIFNGHVDVVPPGDPKMWQQEPFGGTVDEQYIHGRGSVDMKGGNAAALFALKAILKAGYRPKGKVIYQYVVGEECKVTEAGTGAVLEKGYLADAAVIMEPSCSFNSPFEINIASSGVFEVKWKVKGKAVHAGLRSEVIRDGRKGMSFGVDAIEKGMIVYKAIKNLEKLWGQTKHHPLYREGNFCINAATIQAGTAPSLVADSMEMSYAIFYPPQDSPEEIKKEFETQIKNYCNADPWLSLHSPEITWIFNWPSFDQDPNSEIALTMQRAVHQVVPKGGKMTGMFGVCDASFLFEHSIPVVVCGPGETKHTHSAGEKLKISQLMDAAKIYAYLIADWCGLEKIQIEQTKEQENETIKG